MHWRHRSAAQAAFLLTALATVFSATPASALLGLDSTPPNVTIVRPANGASVSGQVALEVRADDGLLGSGVSRVEYQVDTADGLWTALAGSLLSTTYTGTFPSTTVADGAHSLYVRATDNDGNIRLVYSVMVVANPPAAPTGVKVTSAAGSNGGSLDLSWNPNTEADVAGYAIYRSTSAGGPYTKMAGASIGFYRDSGLTNGTAYFYRVTAVDQAGNESPRSSEVSGTPADTRAPTVSGVSVVASGPSFADISWTTDEPSTSQAEYGTTSALGAATAVDTARSFSHRVSITGLQAGRTYFYRARSTDAAGNSGVSQVFSFSTGVDVAPNVSIVNVSNGAVLQAPVTLQVQASDDFGLSSVEYTVDGPGWSPLAFNSVSGYYEARLDTGTVAEGAHKLAARATDSSRQTSQTVIDVQVDRSPPAVSLITPEEAAHLTGGLVAPVSVTASDLGSGVAAVDWQLYMVPFGVVLEAAPDPDPAAWQPLPLNAQTGRYETGWLAPIVVTEAIGYLYIRATDGLGKTSTVTREITVLATGRDFELIGSAGQELSGTIAIEPIGANGGNFLGIQVVGRFLTPGGNYRVTVSGEGATHSAQFTADARGRGDAAVETDTAMTDEFAATITVSGPGF